MMPELVEGKTYRIEDVVSLMDDVGVVCSHRNCYGCDARPLDFGRSDHKIVLEYRVVPLQSLESEITERHELFKNRPAQRERVHTIMALLKGGSVAFPLLVLKGENSHLHPECKIQEGMHRAVAHLLLGSDSLPVFVMRYSDDLGPFEV